MNDPLVSILIPIYNHEKYLLECLNNLLKIDYQNIEIILCNDGSTDRSYDFAKEWCKEQTKYHAVLLSQLNQGICKTLNRLIKNASGEYLVFCASDDYLTIDSIKQRVTFLEAHKDKEACIGDAYLIDQNSRVVSKSAMKHLYNANYNALENKIVSELVLRWSVVGPSLLIRKSAYEKYGYYDENLIIEDRDFYLRILAENKLCFMPKVVAAYRVHTDNISRKNIKSRLIILQEIAKSNIKNARLFNGISKYFLLSHHVDMYFLKIKINWIAFSLLSFYRLIRKCLIKWL